MRSEITLTNGEIRVQTRVVLKYPILTEVSLTCVHSSGSELLCGSTGGSL